ncbi:hypothetical protein QVD17_37815 [Tagetes erecta]|uniref:Retrovirus-related Pol polyprotein from transposon TNT 1-94 n=1 Tax=Tagetes erecta TaxID=13708 RepID=A0AAD8JWN7_TARER|nr:hypothetical protein QVD17_37815 [Tagetes erecta]
MALAEAVKEGLWLKRFVKELGVNIHENVVYCDNMGAVHLSKNSMFHDRTKHIRVRFHFIRDVVNSRKLKVEYISTHDNGADMFTKSLPDINADRASSMRQLTRNLKMIECVEDVHFEDLERLLYKGEILI